MLDATWPLAVWRMHACNSVTHVWWRKAMNMNSIYKHGLPYDVGKRHELTSKGRSCERRIFFKALLGTTDWFLNGTTNYWLFFFPQETICSNGSNLIGQSVTTVSDWPPSRFLLVAGFQCLDFQPKKWDDDPRHIWGFSACFEAVLSADEFSFALRKSGENSEIERFDLLANGEMSTRKLFFGLTSKDWEKKYRRCFFPIRQQDVGLNQRPSWPS